MSITDEMYTLALVAIIIVGLVCFGLLVVLVSGFSRQRQDIQHSPNNSPNPPIQHNQSKRIANCTVAMSAGLTGLVFAARLVPIEQNAVIATILLVLGIGTIIGAWIAFRRI